jgi:hypothetical protein
MKRHSFALFVALVACPLASAAPPDAAAAFAQLKSLEGRWLGHVQQADGPAAEVSYRNISGGTAVMEVLFPGTPHEMTSIYHLDGDQLVMTHYCAMGNQPRMKLVAADGQRLRFDFTGGSNMDAAQSTHIHSGEIRLNGADTMEAEWEVFAKGKAAGSNKFFLKRPKT